MQMYSTKIGFLQRSTLKCRYIGHLSKYLKNICELFFFIETIVNNSIIKDDSKASTANCSTHFPIESVSLRQRKREVGNYDNCNAV